MVVTKKAGSARKATPAKIAPATTQEASGAVIEPSIAKLPDHPAVDRNPREGTTADMNKIDFNDPTKSDEEAVIDNLKKDA